LSQLKHYQDAKFIQMYRRSSCKIVSTKTKQTITNNDLVVDLPTKILDENINLRHWLRLPGFTFNQIRASGGHIQITNMIDTQDQVILTNKITITRFFSREIGS
jgi:hypothetical protein